MKNRIAALLLLVCLAFTGCAPAENETHSHSHSHAYATWWAADAENHWHMCEAESDCAERADLAAHSFSEDACSVCGAVPLDGPFAVEIYDENGNVIYQHSSITSYYSRWVYEYYDDGEIKTKTRFDNGTPREKLFWRPFENGDDGFYIYREIQYRFDGSSDVTEYNEKNDVVISTEYDANGAVTDELRFEYVYNENGKCACRWMYVDGMLDRLERYEFYDSGAYKRSEYLFFDKIGRVSGALVYESDENGRNRKLTNTSYGVLVDMVEYAYVNAELCYDRKITVFRKDGSIEYEKHFLWDYLNQEVYLLKEVFYDHNGEIGKEVYYDREGYARQTFVH